MKIKFLTILSISVVCFSFLGGSVYAQTPSPSGGPEPTVTITTAPEPTSIPTIAPAEPGVPQGITAVAIDHRRVDITWRKAANADSYEVYRNDELVAFLGSLLYPDEGLEPETTYSYKVRSFNGFGYSPFSTVVSVTTKAEADREPEPTLPEDPDVTERQPAVFDSFSFVMVGPEKRDFDEVGEIEAGEEFIVYGKTENYADVEVKVESILNSFYTKADDKGFWSLKINTDNIEAGEHTFQIIITAENFPERYESEEFPFEIMEEEVEEVIEEDTSFGSRLGRIIWVILFFVLLLFVILVVVALKKGWIQKLLGREQKPPTPEGVGSTESTTSSASLEEKFGDIQIDDAQATPVPTQPAEVETSSQSSTPPASEVDPEPVEFPASENPTQDETMDSSPVDSGEEVGEVSMVDTVEEVSPSETEESLETNTTETETPDFSVVDEQDVVTEMNLDSGEITDPDPQPTSEIETKADATEIPDYSSVTDAKVGGAEVQSGSDAREMVVDASSTPSAPIQFGSATSREETADLASVGTTSTDFTPKSETFGDFSPIPGQNEPERQSE